MYIVMLTSHFYSGALHSEGFRQTILPMPSPILTFDQIHEIRTSGLTDAHMARLFGVGYVTVHNARRGITFKDHPTPPDKALRKPGGKNQGARALPSTKNCGVPGLTSEDVHFIRTSGLPDQEMADRFGVSRTLITHARRGLTWKEHPTPADRFPRSFGPLAWRGADDLNNAPSIELGFEPADRERFDRLRMRCKIDDNGCWIWQGSISGYFRPSGNHGHTQVNGTSISTHRAMWIAVYGPIPPTRCVCHECDRPLCLNPEHLWLGTHTQNMRDSIAKGRHVNVRHNST